MEQALAIVLSPVTAPLALLTVVMAAVALLCYWLGLRSGKSGTSASEEALGREMLRMRRQNVVLTEERDQLREVAGRQRRSSQRRATTEEAA